MRSNWVGYYDIYGYNRLTASEDEWLGTATFAVAQAIGAKIGRFVGYWKPTTDGWGCKARK